MAGRGGEAPEKAERERRIHAPPESWLWRDGAALAEALSSAWVAVQRAVADKARADERGRELTVAMREQTNGGERRDIKGGGARLKRGKRGAGTDERAKAKSHLRQRVDAHLTHINSVVAPALRAAHEAFARAADAEMTAVRAAAEDVVQRRLRQLEDQSAFFKALAAELDLDAPAGSAGGTSRDEAAFAVAAGAWSEAAASRTLDGSIAPDLERRVCPGHVEPVTLGARVAALAAELSLAREGEARALAREARAKEEAAKAVADAVKSEEKRTKAERTLRTAERGHREKTEEVGRLHLQLRGAVDGLKRKTDEWRRMQRETEALRAKLRDLVAGPPAPESNHDSEVRQGDEVSRKTINADAESRAGTAAAANSGDNEHVAVAALRHGDPPTVPEPKKHMWVVKKAARESGGGQPQKQVWVPKPLQPTAQKMQASVEESVVATAAPSGAHDPPSLTDRVVRPPESDASDVFVEGPMRGGVDPYRGDAFMSQNKVGQEALLSVNTAGIGPVPTVDGGRRTSGDANRRPHDVPVHYKVPEPPPKDVFLAWVPAGSAGEPSDDQGGATLADKIVPIASLRLDPLGVISKPGSSSQEVASGADVAALNRSHDRSVATTGKFPETSGQRPKSGKSGKTPKQKQPQQQPRRGSEKLPVLLHLSKDRKDNPEGVSAVPTFKASSLLPFEWAGSDDSETHTLDFDFDLIAEKGSRAAALSACAAVLTDILKQETAELVKWDGRLSAPSFLSNRKSDAAAASGAKSTSSSSKGPDSGMGIVGDLIERVRVLEAGFEACVANAGDSEGNTGTSVVETDDWHLSDPSRLRDSIAWTLAALKDRRAAVHARHAHLCSTIETLSSIVATISKPKGWEDDTVALDKVRAVDGVECESLVCSAVSIYEEWQTNFLRVLSPAMERTDRLLVGLHESIAEERRLLRADPDRVHRGFMAAGNLLAAAEAFCWRLVDEREVVVQEHAKLCAVSNECEALSAAAVSTIEKEARRSARASAASAAALSAAGVADATQAASSATIIGSEAAAWAEFETLAEMLLVAKEGVIKAVAERDIQKLRGTPSEHLARRVERRQRRAEALMAEVSAARVSLKAEHRAIDEAMDKIMAAAGKRRREAAALAEAAFQPTLSLLDYTADGTAPKPLMCARGNMLMVEALSVGLASTPLGGEGGRPVDDGQQPRVLVEFSALGKGHEVRGSGKAEDVKAALLEALPSLQALHHPSVPPIELAFVDQSTGRAYVQRPCKECTLVTLEEWLHQDSKGSGRRPLLEICEVFRQLLQAVAHVHRRRMICATLSPKNIHVTSHGLPLILDLPVAQTIPAMPEVAAIDTLAVTAMPLLANRPAPLEIPGGPAASPGKSPSFMHMTLGAHSMGSFTVRSPQERPSRSSQAPRSPEQPIPPTAPVGIPGYMAPEVEAGGQTSPASDLWSFGLMLFEAVFGGASSLADPDVGGVIVPDHEDASVSTLLRSLLRTDPKARMDNAEDVLAHAFFLSRAPVPPHQIVRSVWKARMVRDYGRHVQLGRFPIPASVRLTAVAGTVLGLFSGISGTSLLHPIHLTVLDVPPGYAPPPMAAIYARFFAEMFDPRYGLFETFNPAALQVVCGTPTPPHSPEKTGGGGLQPPLPPGAPPPTAARWSSATLVHGTGGGRGSLGGDRSSGGWGGSGACLLPSAAAAVQWAETYRLIGRVMVKCILDGCVVPDLLAPSVYKYLLGQRVESLRDLEAFHPEEASRLKQVLSATASESTRPSLGGGNAAKGVTREVAAAVEMELVGVRAPALAALRAGFSEVDLSAYLGMFSSSDLRELVTTLTPR